MDADVDRHVHSAVIELLSDDHVRSAWTSFDEGKQVNVATFDVTRVE